jgi:pantoate--beta-alanine ligase
LKILETIKETKETILRLKKEGNSVGFVPTMGALHEGHLSLLRHSMIENDISVCSIFVNPIQFNNKQDLEKYPRTLEADCKKLENAGCDLVFAPSLEEMYPAKVEEHYDFGHLERVMEGAHRPGHFNGVAVVVKRLFDICTPHRAYFGEKDFQQLRIIQSLVEQENMPVEIIGCPIIRENDGLAMSSRNIRLSAEERKIAPAIYESLKNIREQVGNGTVNEVLRSEKEKLNSLPGMKVEYLVIASEDMLEPASEWDETKKLRAFIATFLGEIRLIDNLKG